MKKFGLGVAGALLAGAYLVWRRRPGASMKGRVVVITGGSRGLGLELARQLGSVGARLALIARDGEELGRAAAELRREGYEVTTWVKDLLRLAEIPQLVQDIAAHYGRIDVLINNAGEITFGPFESLEAEDFDRALAIHLGAPLRMIQGVVPLMKRQGRGRIVNISSIGGKIPAPHLSSYCASKFALVGLSGTLRAELAKDRIIVTTVCPGLMRTGSHWNAQFTGRFKQEFAWFAHAASTPLTAIAVQRAAAQIIGALRRGDAELTITVQAKLAALGFALFPSWMQTLEGLVNLMLPSVEGGHRHPHTGWESRSEWVPSVLTTLGDQAAVRNNELRGNPPPAENRS